jgi:pre-mRNA cleavage complex 2 protein Pcf11
VPDPSSGTNTECPICRDRFENKWLHTVQDWVWMDVILVKGRAYHASCHAMLATDRARGATPSAGAATRGTPEPVLGKRKAEGEDGKSEKRRIS